jgi:DNA-binding beta-propeller fold protein YncE
MKQRGSARSLSVRLLVTVAGSASAFALTPLLSLTACNLDNPGVSPPRGVLAYPIALGLSSAAAGAEPAFLYVVNSNFDIRYNAGSIHSYDLEAIEAAVRNVDPTTGKSCLEQGVPVVERDAGSDMSDGGMSDGGVELPDGYDLATDYGTPRGVLCDGRDLNGADQCCFDDSEQFLKSEVLIDSYATGLATRTLGTDADRLYVPLRSSNDLLFLDARGGALDCGGGKRCERSADGENPNAPDESFPTQPAALVVGTLGQVGVTDPARADLTFVSTVHERGSVSLFVEPSANAAPLLQDVWTPGSAIRATSVALGPSHQALYVTASDTQNAFLLGVRGARSASDRDLLVSSNASVLALSGLSQALDLRDIEVDAVDPTLVYALVRGALESLVFLRLDSTTVNNARLIGATRVGAGPSKLTQATLGGRRVLLVSCYNARAIFIIDTLSRELVEVVRGLAGPFEMVVDEQRELIYVADFGASVLRVVDAAGVADRSRPPPRIVATLGERYYGGGL